MGQFFKPLRESVKDFATWAVSDHPKIPTGFRFVDEMTEGGVTPGGLVIITGRSSVGKTWAALHTMWSNPGIPTVMFSLEMSSREIVQRMAAIHSNLPTAHIMRQMRDTGHSAPLQQLVDDYPQLAIIDDPALSLKDMQKALNEAKEEWGVNPQLAVIDHLRLVGGTAALSSLDKMKSLATGVKNLARRNDMVTVALQQVSRGSGGAGHLPLDITSGEMAGEDSADILLGTYRPCMEPGLTQEAYQQKFPEYQIQYLKTRVGGGINPTGKLHFFNGASGRISAWQDQDELFPARPPAIDPKIVALDTVDLYDDYDNIEPWSA